MHEHVWHPNGYTFPVKEQVSTDAVETRHRAIWHCHCGARKYVLEKEEADAARR